jgi:hypothetical protein
MPTLCAVLCPPFGARTYNGGMNNSRCPPEEVNTMAKKDEGRRDIKKDKERDH